MTELWITLIIVGLLTLAIRLSFILLLEKWQPPALFQRSLRFVPLAVLSALIFPDVLIKNNIIALPPDIPRLASAITAILVAWKTKNTFLTIGAGMLLFFLLRLFFH